MCPSVILDIRQPNLFNLKHFMCYTFFDISARKTVKCCNFRKLEASLARKEILWRDFERRYVKVSSEMNTSRTSLIPRTLLFEYFAQCYLIFVRAEPRSTSRMVPVQSGLWRWPGPAPPSSRHSPWSAQSLRRISRPWWPPPGRPSLRSPWGW